MTFHPPAPIWHAFDLAPLQDSHVGVPGFYLAVSSAEPRRDARGWIVQESTDRGITWREAARIQHGAWVGTLISITDNTGIDVTVIDESTVFRIEMPRTIELSSISDDEAARGKNSFLIGDEILSAAICAFVSEDVTAGTSLWDLSRMYRGKRDTDDVTDKEEGDRVVWLEGGGLAFIERNAAAVGEARSYRVVPHGGIPEDFQAHRFTLTGRTASPPRVTDIAGTRDGPNNLTLTWAYQTRRTIRVADHDPTIDDEIGEVYLVEILDAPGGSVLRSTTVTAPTVVYTAANQIIDGLTPGDPVDVRITQKSKAFRLGRPREATV